MGGYLNNIIARSTGLAPVVQPRPVSMYEPVAESVMPVAERLEASLPLVEETAFETCKVVDAFRKAPADRDGSDPGPVRMLRTPREPAIPDFPGAERTAEKGGVSAPLPKPGERSTKAVGAVDPADLLDPMPVGKRKIDGDEKKETVNSVISGGKEEPSSETDSVATRKDPLATLPPPVIKVAKTALVEKIIQVSVPPRPSTNDTEFTVERGPSEAQREVPRVSSTARQISAVPFVAESSPVAGHSEVKRWAVENGEQSRSVFKSGTRHVADDRIILQAPVRTDERRPFAGKRRREPIPGRGEKTAAGKASTVPTINVTIGRIEVRATPPEQPDKRKTAPRTSSLDEYLGRRGKGGHR